MFMLVLFYVGTDFYDWHDRRSDISKSESRTHRACRTLSRSNRKRIFVQKTKITRRSLCVSVQKDVDGILSRAISKATVNMLYVGGYIVLCGMIIDTLELLGIRNLLENFGAAGEPILSLIYSLVEMTRASIECSKCGNLQLATALCSGAVSFGGLSITMQNYTFLSKCGVGFLNLCSKNLRNVVLPCFLRFYSDLPFEVKFAKKAEKYGIKY